MKIILFLLSIIKNKMFFFVKNNDNNIDGYDNRNVEKQNACDHLITYNTYKIKNISDLKNNLTELKNNPTDLKNNITYDINNEIIKTNEKLHNIIINTEKYKYLKWLKNNSIPIFNKLHYVEEYNSYFHNHSVLLPNYLKGLKEEMNGFL